MVHLKIFNKTPINYTYSVTYSGPVTLNILNGKLHSVYCALSLFFQHTLDDITKAFLWLAKWEAIILMQTCLAKEKLKPVKIEMLIIKGNVKE